MFVDGYLFSSNLWYINEIIPKSLILSIPVLEYKLFWKPNIVIKKQMIKNFLIISCIGKSDKIGLRVDDNFFIHDFHSKTKNNDQIVQTILNLIKKHKVNFNEKFSILVNYGPGSFSSMRVSIAVAKGIKLTKKINFL